MPGGRPTACTKKIIKKARRWIDGAWRTQDTGTPDFPPLYPTVYMLERHLGISHGTTSNWVRDRGKSNELAQFFEIYQQLREEKKRILSIGGLLGKFTPKITSLLLSHCGVIEIKQQQLTGKEGGPVELSITKALDEVDGSGLVGGKK